MRNVRSSQPCISMNFCTEFSKAQVFPCEYRPSRQILFPAMPRRHPTPLSPGRPLNILFHRPADVPIWCPMNVLLWRPRDIPVWCPIDIPIRFPKDTLRATFRGPTWEVAEASVVCSRTSFYFSAQKLNWFNLSRFNTILSCNNWRVYGLITDSWFSGLLYRSYALYWR